MTFTEPQRALLRTWFPSVSVNDCIDFAAADDAGQAAKLMEIAGAAATETSEKLDALNAVKAELQTVLNGQQP